MNIRALRTLLEKGKLEPFIRHIRFPQYKNIYPFTQIDFSFPITALVGANGTNKSSLLKALYGAPGSNNLGNYWFSTEIDPILDGDDFPSCFVYGYINDYTKEIVEVVKTRVRKENDPDYWEPSRPIIRYGMAAMPEMDINDPNRSQTRWKAISKKVNLIDFRHALSAFDRYFYHGDFNSASTFSEKKAFIRSRAPHLKTAIDLQSRNYFYYNVDRIIKGQNSTLTVDELTEVKKILGRDYNEIKLIDHKFFKNEGYTARITSSNHNYTEAFAGSGEFAVIMLVTRIMRAHENSLILLDEPEVSLHPGAQERLLNFLGEQVLKFKHQVIFTTHSPALIRGLPPDAIKVLNLERQSSRVVLASQKSTAEEAFIQIGEPITGFKSIITEDRLAIEIVKKALRIHNPSKLKIIKFQFYPGGASVLFNHYIPPYSAEDRKDILCIFDADQNPNIPWPCSRELRQIDASELGELIKALSGSNITFPINSGTKEEKALQTESAQRKFLSWAFSNIRYLPGNNSPEDFLLSKLGYLGNGDSKSFFIQLTRESLGLTVDEDDPDSDSIFQEQCRRVAEIPDDDQDLAKIARIVEEFLANGAG